ncbi:hypothetical protein FJY90_01705 [Candidatus Gottesmanbacteria bacterium]|nr:hypothetical protein [Candidatus Gottesmanbacteria bacterium]
MVKKFFLISLICLSFIGIITCGRSREGILTSKPSLDPIFDPVIKIANTDGILEFNLSPTKSLEITTYTDSPRIEIYYADLSFNREIIEPKHFIIPKLVFQKIIVEYADSSFYKNLKKP